MATVTRTRSVPAVSRRFRLRTADLLRLPATVAVAALAGPLVVAAALIPARTWLTPANVALVLVGVVVLVAVLGGRLAAVVAALGSMLWFDVFHTRPYYSLTISRHQDITTAALLLAVGLAVGELSTRSRRHQAAAELGSVDIGRIHVVAELVASGEEADYVVLAVAGELRNLLQLRDIRFEYAPFRPDEGDHLKARPRIEHDGSVSFGIFGWGAATMGLPSKLVDLPVMGRGRELGRFEMQPTPGLPIDLDRRMVAVALADQVGAALVGPPTLGRP